MFIGHYAPAFVAAARGDGRTLGPMLVAAQLTDVGFFSLQLAGVEHFRPDPTLIGLTPIDLYHMPFTHSLLGSIIIGLLFALAWRAGSGAWRAGGGRWSHAAPVAGLVVVSHWFIDWLVHRPDLTLWGTPPKLGLGLWEHPMIAIPLELALIGGAMLIYVTRHPAMRKRVAMLAAVLLVAQIVNWTSPAPPDDGPATALTALAAYTVIAMIGWWASRAGVSADRAAT